MKYDIQIVSGGLGGTEGTWQLAKAGLRVRLSEMRGGGGMQRPRETATGAFLEHVTSGAEADTSQPMNVSFGLMPQMTGGRAKKLDRKKAYRARRRSAFARVAKHLRAPFQPRRIPVAADVDY